jgi:hypothetical protein
VTVDVVGLTHGSAEMLEVVVVVEVLVVVDPADTVVPLTLTAPALKPGTTYRNVPPCVKTILIVAVCPGARLGVVRPAMRNSCRRLPAFVTSKLTSPMTKVVRESRTFESVIVTATVADAALGALVRVPAATATTRIAIVPACPRLRHRVASDDPALIGGF